MTVRRVMGTETEYGIVPAMSSASTSSSAPAAALAPDSVPDPVLLSRQLVEVAGRCGSGSLPITWDYATEHPTQDARGFHVPRSRAHPGLLTDDPRLNITNVMAPNGGRIYLDHAHPEYSAPETTNPFQALLYDKAGDRLMQEAAQEAGLILYRNNCDGRGAAWGAHENYRIKRAVPFEDLARIFLIHAVSRQIFTGSGRWGLGQEVGPGSPAGFQISQRADYCQEEVGLQTTFDRPIVNSRDESHDRDDFRRFHVIVGDANCMECPEVLKLGTSSLLFWLLEEEEPDQVRLLLDSLIPPDPVAALRQVSRDLTLRRPIRLKSGEDLTAWQMQVRLRSAVCRCGARLYGADSTGLPLWPDQETRQVVDLWGQVLRDLALVARTADDGQRLSSALDGPAGRLEWFAKWRLLESLRRRWKASWSDRRLRAADLQWAQLGPESLRSRAMPQAWSWTTPEQVIQASNQPPAGTRAVLRAILIKNHPHNLASLSWESATLVDSQGRAHHLRLPDPLLPEGGTGHDLEEKIRSLIG